MNYSEFETLTELLKNQTDIAEDIQDQFLQNYK